MKYDISALGNALVDTQYKVSHEFLSSVGLEADSMTLASAEEQAPIIEKLISMGAESVSDCGGSATNSLVAAANYGSKCHHVCRVSDDEDGRMDVAEQEFYDKALALANELKEEAYEIGGDFRGPGYEHKLMLQVKDAFKKAKLKLR